MGLSLLQQPKETHPHPSNFPYPQQPRKRASLSSPYPPATQDDSRPFLTPPSKPERPRSPPLWQPETAASLFPSLSVQLLAKRATLRQYLEKLNVFWTKISESECRPPSEQNRRLPKLLTQYKMPGHTTTSFLIAISHNRLYYCRCSDSRIVGQQWPLLRVLECSEAVLRLRGFTLPWRFARRAPCSWRRGHRGPGVLRLPARLHPGRRASCALP